MVFGIEFGFVFKSFFGGYQKNGLSYQYFSDPEDTGYVFPEDIIIIKFDKKST